MELEWLKIITEWIKSKIWRQMDPSGWTYLPDIVLIEVYSYLGDNGRASMAVTCKNWHRVFQTPRLWRTRHVELGGYLALKAGLNACSFADQHGRHIQRLKLSCNHPSHHTCKLVQRNIEEFLDKIKTCRLASFDFGRLELDRFWKYENLREKVIDSICRFIRSQKNIKEFDMSSAQASLTSGCKLLDHLGNASGDVLKNLGIEDFFHSRLAIFQVKRFRCAVKKFTNLTDISINYNCLSDDILEILSKQLAGKLKHILVKVYRADPHFHRISRNAWKLLKTVCPGLTVEVWFESIGFASDIVPILVPEMPLQDMHIWTGYNDDSEWNLPDTINHVATHFRKTLHSLSLELDNNDEFIDEALLRLMSKCTCIQELTINAAMHVFTVETICDMQREKKINLQLLHLTVCGLRDIEWAELSYLRERYQEDFAQSNIDFRLQSDLMIDN